MCSVWWWSLLSESFFWMFAFLTADSYTCETLREGERSVIIWSSGRLIQLLYRTCWEWERVGTHTRKACLPTYQPTTAASLHTRHGCTRLFSGSSLCFLHINCHISVWCFSFFARSKLHKKKRRDQPWHSSAPALLKITLLQTIWNIAGMHQREPVIGRFFFFSPSLSLRVGMLCCPAYSHCGLCFAECPSGTGQIYYVIKTNTKQQLCFQVCILIL